MDKKEYDELSALSDRLKDAQCLLLSPHYGWIKKGDDKFYWNLYIGSRWVYDKYRRTVKREVPYYWNWVELDSLDCARLFIQGDLIFHYSLDEDGDDCDSIGRRIFGDEVWSEASRLFNEDEDGEEYVRLSDLEDTAPLIFPEPAPLPSVEDLHDWRRDWFLPNEEDFVAYLKGDMV